MQTFLPYPDFVANTTTRASERIQMNATLHECGNGLPSKGDYVPGTDGLLYRVLDVTGPIHTGSYGAGNYIHASVELADWDDLDEDEEPASGYARVDLEELE